MKNVPNDRLSQYRQAVVRQLARLKELFFKAAHSDLLFHGTPLEFYKRCGKKGCRCAEGNKQRHGPYRAIQVWVDGQQRQVRLKTDEGRYYEMAQHYQYQQQNRAEVQRVQQELLELLDQMLEARTICSKE